MQVQIATAPATPGQPNEDFAAATANAIVLLDGAGLSGTTSRCTHGVAWYARHLGGALLAGLADNDSTDLRDILAQAITETAGAHGGTCDLDDPGTPSATVVILRAAGDRLDYLVLADSVLVLDQRDNAPLIICDDREAIVGERHRVAMNAAVNDTMEHDNARREYVQTLRQYRNQPGGFWVAAANPAAAAEAIAGSRPLSGVSAAALLSDGASRLADRFALADWPRMLHILRNHGPEELIRRVREAEASDPNGSRWPRGKTYDDATVAYTTDFGHH